MSDMSWEQISGRRMVVPDHVVHRALPQETVLLNVSTSTYHAVDEVGARFFEVLLAAPSLASAGRDLAEEYGQPLERIQTDLTTFCSDLLERDLIRLDDA